jgi:peptidoglycan/xylan/chitin deacetylase (PgdA/CDA1 family)
MTNYTTKLLKTALSALHYTGVDALVAPYTRGAGIVFMLHHVTPEAPGAFDPNRILRVTPTFLDSVIGQVLAAGFDVLSLDDAHDRLKMVARDRRTPTRPFACFTFDDGYKDNLVHAYPVFKRRNLPFTIYVPTDYPGGTGDLWWLALERVVREAPAMVVQMEGQLRTFQCHTAAEKDQAFHDIYWWLRSIPEDRARQVVQDLVGGIGFKSSTLCTDLIMTWDQIRTLASDPLVTIGAHTKRHFALAKLPTNVVEEEIRGSIARLEAELGTKVRHFSFPYGDETSCAEREYRIAAEAGMLTAVTTRKGMIHSHHASELTALPRVSLNGDYQDARYVKVFLNGTPFALWNMLRGTGPKAA